MQKPKRRSTVEGFHLTLATQENGTRHLGRGGGDKWYTIAHTLLVCSLGPPSHNKYECQPGTNPEKVCQR